MVPVDNKCVPTQKLNVINQILEESKLKMNTLLASLPENILSYFGAKGLMTFNDFNDVYSVC